MIKQEVILTTCFCKVQRKNIKKFSACSYKDLHHLPGYVRLRSYSKTSAQRL